MSKSELRKSDEEAPGREPTQPASRNELVFVSQKTQLASEFPGCDQHLGSISDGIVSEERQDLTGDDESSNNGFIVIKPSSVTPKKDMENRKDEETQSSSNVIVLQNPSEMSLEGLDTTVLNQVQRALEESGMEHSVMIVNGDDDTHHVEKQTSYVIDLNTDTSQSQEPSLNTLGSNGPPSPVKTSITSHSSSTALFSKLVTPSLIHDTVPETSSSHEHSDLLKTSFSQGDTITITMPFCSENSDVSLNSPTPVAADDVSNVSSVQRKTVIKAPAISSDNSCFENSTPKNLCHASSSQDQLNSQSSLMDEKPASMSATSHVAEQLLNIAKKMIGESSSTSQRISVDETMGKIVISPEQKTPRDKTSESVITMYLSSPNDLKSKLEKFKTDSPVIIVQAGEEPLTEEDDDEDEENLESVKAEKRTASIQRDAGVNIESPIAIDSTGMTVPRTSGSITSQSDSLAAALSSFAADSVLYSCSECGYSSHNKHYYKQHVDLVHNEDRPYKCSHCDYAGKRRHALLEHMVVHSDQRPYSCNYCNASFRKKGHLTNHVKLHTSQRLVPCGVCNIQLPDAEAFESHLRKIHNTDKLYKCKLCDHTVVDRQAMLNHLASHNEGSALFSCPQCSSHFQDESTLCYHLKESHGIIKVGGEGARATPSSSSFSSSDSIMTAAKTVTAAGDEAKAAQQANIVCSECGFMCADAQVMKKHMWVHIDSSSDMNVQIKGQAPSHGNSPAPNSSNAMNVLKMNVVSGLKTLPENVMYQCTSCNFTSSDNSVFIKHMLLHKTQRKSHAPVTKSDSQSDENEVAPCDKSSQGKTISVLSSNTSHSQVSGGDKERPTSNVPFVFDQSSGRFRCLICGYHCDYQRTIKAHIWKHSGHQNIEYPVFDQTKKGESTDSFSAKPPNTEAQQKTPPSSTIPVPSVSARPIPMPVQPVQLLKTSSGDIVKLLPVDPKTSKYKPGDLIQIKDNAIIVSEKCEKDSPADRFLKTLTVPGNVKSENEIPEAPASVAKEVQLEDEDDFKFELKKESGLLNPSTYGGVLQDKRSQMNKGEPYGKNPQDESGCTEPSVVVEIVDTVPSVLGLTGLKSQQGSPRVSDLECSGGEAKLSIALKEAFSSEKSLAEGSSLVQLNDREPSKCKYNLRKPKDSKAAKSPPQDERSTSEALSTDSKVSVDAKRCHALKEPEDDEETENLNNAESDSTESSDEINSAGESGSSSNPPKTGICSSLLAVIEQLRERSRSEGEKSVSPTKDVPKRVSKRNKKHSPHADTAPLSEFHNIEKIGAGDGEKYRCSLCHYTSQRICNMRLHMKTHRQKKPSECSLCDYSSSIPEDLQEHMLLHCKVRTYACKFCPQNFNHKSTLRAHMRAHKDKEPFLCAYCVFEASTSTELKEHMLVHSGCSSRLRCPGCDNIMNNKEELTSHLMKCTGKGEFPTVLTVSDSKPVEEVQDQKSSGSSVNESTATLPATSISNQESTAATEHACVVKGCSFTSFSLKELQEHLSVHCNPSLLLCDLCDFKALHSRSLKSHMKRHANDQRYVQQPLEQYKCNLCGYVCHHLPSLKSHMWRHASDQSYSYEFTNDVINAAIDHDSRIDANAGEADDPELLDRVINSERRIMEGELTKSGQGDGQRPTCWVTFRCCSCGFETINKAKLNIHMRSHSDIIKQTLDGIPSALGSNKAEYASAVALAFNKTTTKRAADAMSENEEPFVPMKVKKVT